MSSSSPSLGSLSLRPILPPVSSAVSSALPLASSALPLASSAFPFASSVEGASGAASFALEAASSPSFGLGGSFGDLVGAELLALSVAPLAVDFGVFVADLAVSLGSD